MKHTEVESSNIFSIGYNPKKNTMEITFRKRDKTPGKTYSYNPVSPEGYREIMTAESKGKFFNTHIKNNSMINVKEIS